MEGTQKGEAGSADLFRSGGCSSFLLSGKADGKEAVEVYDRIDKPTLTGRLVYPIVDCFIVQWEEQKQVYKKAVNLGSIF